MSNVQLVFAGAFTLSYTSNGMTFDSLIASPTGCSIGYRWKDDVLLPYIEYQSTSDSGIGLDYSAFSVGAQKVTLTKDNFTMGFNIEGGFGTVSISDFSNDFDFFSFGGGIFANYAINNAINLFIQGQYIYYHEITSNTRCRDGSDSQSVGSGTCSYHGGIAFYNDKIGNADGMKLNVGFSISF